MSSTARFHNAPPGPPHDPTWMLLGGRQGWPLAAPSTGVTTSPLDCALVLDYAPLGGASLADPSGRFGGLVPPPTVALSPDGGVWLLDRARGRVRRFDDCTCAFVDIPYTGGPGAGARHFANPIGIALRGQDLLVLDSGAPPAAPGRLLAFACHTFALRTVSSPPPGAVPLPWQPSAFTVTRAGRTLVADVANGVVHVFDRGGAWRRAWTGFGAVAAMASDRFGRFYTWGAADGFVRIYDADGAQVAQASDVATVCDCFAELKDFSSDPSGGINLAGRCLGATWFDAGGTPTVAPTTVAPVYAASGVWLTSALDSAIGRCTWHRVVLHAERPPGTSLTLATYTSEVSQPIDLIAALPPSAWTAVPLSGDKAWEALILSPPGRYLWLRATLTGDQQATPRMCGLRLEYPRISLRRYLPRAFGADPVSADFTDRLLGVFDQGFRSVEGEIDRQADLFDARSAPALARVAGIPDMLSWLAGWIGVTFERQWPVARRRHFLLSAAKYYACRGTPRGLRQALILYLGLDTIEVCRRPARCAPPCSPSPMPWHPPQLVLEHWKIRRWLWLGAGRLGDASQLWGESILGRSQLDNNAQVGATHLDTSRQAVLDPFNADAYAFTVFVPSGLTRTSQQQMALRRFLDQESPAWTQAELRIVRPRMRLGIQASIGFDAVVGCWPGGVRLDQARLGKATVLGTAANVDVGPRVGRDRIGSGLRIA